jgi:hypothetical protein
MDPGDLEVWSNHFEYHALRPSVVAQDTPDSLKPGELRLIAKSIATVQLGEQAAGPELLRAAERFAQTKRIAHLARITELLIHEELRHGSLLHVFMRNHWIPTKRSGWSYPRFGYIRGLAGLHWQVSMLISAELAGIVYYRALESVTDCQRLRLLCRVIVSDKLAHVGFESELLATLRADRAASLQALTRLAHRIFFTSAAVVVWWTHRPVLRRAGHSARSFLRACLAQYEFYMEPTRVPAVITAAGGRAGWSLSGQPTTSTPATDVRCMVRPESVA